MSRYFLVIDTETSGLPKDWNLPYSDEHNWPFTVQISWILFSETGEKLKEENHFIGDDDIVISIAALSIHGITKEYIKEYGEPRKTVLERLSNDLNKYRPLIIGHFMELDYHVTSADFYRAEMSNPMALLPLFCTLKASEVLSREIPQKPLRLGQLYYYLFETDLVKEHDALLDARATAACFFEMKKRGIIDDEIIANQKLLLRKTKTVFWLGYFVVVFLVLLLIILYLLNKIGVIH